MPTRSKPSRRTRAELKALMIEAGKAVLLGLEPSMGFEGLTYSVVFEHLMNERGVRVTTGSVHERIWQSQSEFQLDVLANVIAATPQQTFDLAHSGALQALNEASLVTIADRKYSAQNIVRVLQNNSAAADNFAGFGTPEEKIAFITRSRLWELDGGDETTAAIAKLILQHREQSAALYVEMIDGLMHLLGLRKSAWFADTDMDLLVVLGNATAAGLLTDPLPAANMIFELPTGRNGEAEPWHTTSIGLWAIVRNMLEIDDDSLSETERRL